MRIPKMPTELKPGVKYAEFAYPNIRLNAVCSNLFEVVTVVCRVVHVRLVSTSILKMGN